MDPGFEAIKRAAAEQFGLTGIDNVDELRRVLQVKLSQANAFERAAFKMRVGTILREMGDGGTANAGESSTPADGLVLGTAILIRAAFRELLDLKLSEFTTARVDRWRASRRSRHTTDASKEKSREVSRSTINRNVSALRAALATGVEWGAVSAMPLGKIKRKSEDENAVVRYRGKHNGVTQDLW